MDVISPANSYPTTYGGWIPAHDGSAALLTSTGFTPAVATATTAHPPTGAGAGTSLTRNPSGDPGVLITTARIGRVSHGRRYRRGSRGPLRYAGAAPMRLPWPDG